MEYIVTSLADSGSGTLRNAIAQANAYEGDEEVVITFAEDLSGEIALSSALSITRELTLNNNADASVSLTGYGLNTSANLTMNNMVLPKLTVTAAVELAGEGNTFTGTGAVVQLADAMVDMSGFRAASEQDGCYVSVQGNTVRSDTEWTVLGAGLASYKLDVALSVIDGATLTLGRGVVLCSENASYDINVDSGSSFHANGGTLNLLGVTSSDRSTVRANSGGTVLLENVTVNCAGSGSLWRNGNFHVCTGGSIVIRNSVLEQMDGMLADAGGTLVIEDSVVNTPPGLAIVLSRIANVEIHNCDLSGVSKIDWLGAPNDVCIIDLSDNWWGTTDINEISSRIRAGSWAGSWLIIDNYLTEPPLDKFTVLGLEGSNLLSANTRSITIRFSHPVDETSLQDGAVYMEDSKGVRVPFTGISVEGKTATISFDPLPADGNYRLVIRPEVRSIDGKTLEGQFNESGLLDYRVQLRADVTPECVLSLAWENADLPSYLDLNLSGIVDSSTVRAGDFSVTSASGASVRVRSVGMPSSSVIRLYLDTLMEPGTYTVGLSPNVRDYAGNAFNTADSATQVEIHSSSLQVQAAEDSYQAVVNGQTQITVNVTNSGDVDETTATLKIWLERSGQGRVLLRTIEISDLAAGETRALECTLAPADSHNLEEATYNLVAEISGSHEMPSLRGDNSSAIGTVDISYPPAPDFRITSLVAPDSIRPGEKADFTVTVSNAGDAPAEEAVGVEFFLIPAGGSIAQGVSLGVFRPAGREVIAAGSELTYTLEGVAVPAGITLYGNVQVAAVVNPDRAIYETPANRSNNSYVAEDVLELPHTLTLELSQTEVREGDTRKVVYTITRSGGASNSLTVQLTCGQAELLGLPRTLTLAAGQTSTRYQAAIVDNKVYQGDQTVEIGVSAAGYVSSTAQLTVLDDEQPALTLSLSADRAAEGGRLSGIISLAAPVAVDTVVKLGCTLGSQISMPASVIIPAGGQEVVFDIVVVDDSVAEPEKELKITAVAEGFESSSAKLVIEDDDTPMVQLVLDKDIVSESDGYYATTATLLRTGGSTEAVTITLEDLDGIGLILPSSVKMAEGVNRVQFVVGVLDDSQVNGERTGRIRGHIVLDSCGCSLSNSPGGGVLETRLTVRDNDSPALSVRLSKTVIREGGEELTLTVQSNFVTDKDVTVRLTAKGGDLDIPAELVIRAGESSASCTLSAISDGVTSGNHAATITASAEGVVSGTAYMTVTDVDLPDLVVDKVSLVGPALAGQTAQVEVSVLNQGYAAASRATSVRLKLSDGTDLGSIRLPESIPAGAGCTLQTQIKLPEKSGSFLIIAEVDAEDIIPELNEKNNYASSPAFQVGTGYTIQAEVDEHVLVNADSLQIRGQIAADAEGLSVAGKTVTLHIRTSAGIIASLQAVTEEDGSFSVPYTLPKGICGEFTVTGGLYSDVTHELDTFAVAGLSVDTSGSGLQWVVTEGDTCSGSVLVRNKGGVALHNVALSVLQLPDNVRLSLVDDSPVDLQAGESHRFAFVLEGVSANTGDLYSGIDFRITSDESVGAAIRGYSYVDPIAGKLKLDVDDFTMRITEGGTRYVELTITNYGAGDSGRVNISLPSGLDWLDIYSGGDIPNLRSGESATVVLRVDTPANGLVLNADYTGRIAVLSENAGHGTVDYSVRFVGAEKASLQVDVFDAFSLQMEDNRTISGARVALYNGVDNTFAAVRYADEQGKVSFSDLEAGYYYLVVEAEGCESYRMLVQLHPGDADTQSVYLTNRSVTYTFVVTPTEIEDRYEIVQNVEFVTNVPAAAVVFDTSCITIPDLDYGESAIVSFTVSNYGLVAAQGYTLTMPDFPGLEMTVLNPIDSLAALSSHTFYVQVQAPDSPDTKSGIVKDWNCLTGYAIHNYFDCTSSGEWRFNSTVVQTEGDCPEVTSKPLFELGQLVPVPHHGIGGGGDDSAPSRNKKKNDSNGGSSSPKVPQFVQDMLACSPCKADLLNAYLKCLGWDNIQIEKPNLCTILNIAGLFFAPLEALGQICEAIDDLLKKLECLKAMLDAAKNCLDSYFGKGAVSDDVWGQRFMDLMDEVEKRGGVIADLSLYYTGPFDVRPLFSNPACSLEAVSAWLGVLQDAILDSDGNASPITEQEKAALGACALNAYAKEGFLDALYDRWNRTLEYNARGIYSVSDVPDGESTDFFSTEYMEALADEYKAARDTVISSGFTGALGYYQEACNAIRDFMEAEGNVCATVKLQFAQSATMSREAFEGVLTLTNNDSSNALENLHFSVWVRDLNGVDVTEHFNIRYTEISGMDSIDGGTLAAGSTGVVRIQYVPDKTIAADSSTEYRFGASLAYNNPSDGEESNLTLTPVTLMVNPSPNLSLHYFLTEDVYSDDPFTDKLEAAQMAEIGLLVKNTGNGVAKNFTLSDFHPTYLSSEQGLALKVQMLGSSLNGGEMQLSGTSLSFGDIKGKDTATAVWYFSTDVHGYFRNYTSTFRHVDSMGGEAFSLIDETVTHMLVRSMDVDGDGKTDFLVNDDNDALKLADGLYLGNGAYESVHALTSAQVDSGSLYADGTVILEVLAMEGWNYLRINDPGYGNYRITGVSIGGVQLDPSMFWQTDRYFAEDGAATYVDRLHLVFENASGDPVSIVLTYDPVDTRAPEVECISGVENRKTLREMPESLTVTFTEDVIPGSFSAACVSLLRNGQEVDLSGLAWSWQDARTLILTNIRQFTSEDALYTLSVRNTGVQDISGNAGDGSGARLQWTLAAGSLAVESVLGYYTRKPNKPVEELIITFTESVADFAKDALELHVQDFEGNDRVLELPEDVFITEVAGSEGKSYLVGGMNTLQLQDGVYSLSIDTSKVTAANSSVCLESGAVEWELHATPPSVIGNEFVDGEILVQKVDSVILTFSHAMQGLDVAGLTLYRNGILCKTDTLNIEVDSDNPCLVRVSGLSTAEVDDTGRAAVSQDAVYELVCDLEQAVDAYGNTGSGTYTSTWGVDATPPDSLASVQLNGRLYDLGAGDVAVVGSRSVSLAFDVPEDGLRIYIYDKAVTDSGSGVLLAQLQPENRTVEQTLSLNNDGNRTLVIVMEDAAGNRRMEEIPVLVDPVALTVAIGVEDKYVLAPESIRLAFSAPVEGVCLEAIQITCDGVPMDISSATLTQVGDMEWSLDGMDSIMTDAGEYVVTVDLTRITKVSSGIAGSSGVAASFTLDPVTSVEVSAYDLKSSPGMVESLSVTFSAGINYKALSAAGLLSQAVYLVDLSSGERLALDASGFSYADATLTWKGPLAIECGEISIAVDGALVTAANGSPLVVGPSATVGCGFGSEATLLGGFGESFTAPYAVDWNGDGLIDLLVGEKADSTTGKVRIYLNNGTAQTPSYTTYEYLQADGADLIVAANGCQGIVIALQDLNGDGKADIVAGRADGGVVYFLAGENGSFGTAQTLTTADGSALEVASRAFPTFFDWNEDGTADLIIGAGSGSLYWAAGSVAADGSMAFGGLEIIDGITVSGRAAPVFADVNGDGTADLLLGDSTGKLTLFYGTGTGYALVQTWTLEGVDWERTRPTMADINGDGKQDIIVGGSTGSVYALYGRNNTWSSAPVEISQLPGIPSVQLTGTDSTLTIAWDVTDAPAGATYKVQLSAKGDFSDAAEYAGNTSGTLTVKKVADGVYTARVQMITPDGIASEWRTSQTAIVDTVAPTKPSGLSVQVEVDTISFAWAGVEDPSGVRYEIRYAQKPDFSEANVRETSAPAFTITGLPDGTWYWQVRAVDGKGNASGWTGGEAFGVDSSVVNHWVRGLDIEAGTGMAIGGFQDVAKSGTSADSNLCWAASSSNLLAWWQQTYDTASLAHIDVATDAAGIYAEMSRNWKNVSGRELNGLIWWLDGAESTDADYLSYSASNLTGTEGSFYSECFDAESLAAQAAEVDLRGMDGAAVVDAWTELVASGAAMSLGIYKNISVSGSLSGGHAVTLWGFDTLHCNDSLTRIYVTDSDDGVEALVSLEIGYDAASGYYRITDAASRLDGYYLGNYTYLAAPGKDAFPELTAPAEVGDLAYAQADGTTVLSWEAVQHDTKVYYVVEASHYADFREATRLETFSCEAVLPASGTKNLFFRVKTVDAVGNASDWSGLDLLSATTKGKKVTFGWPAVDGAYNYVVTITRADCTGKPTVKKVTKAKLSVSLKDADYNWTVQATTKKGEVLEVMTGRSFRVDSTAPTKVAKLASAAKEPGEGNTIAVLTWAASTDVSDIHYRVEYSTNKSFKKGTVQTVEVEGTSVELPVEAGKYVYYRVTAVDSFGNKSKAVSGSYAQPTIAPASVQEVKISGKKATFAWEAVEGAKSYIVKITNAKGKVITKTFKTNKGVVSLGESVYTWTVQAVSAAGVKSAVTAAQDSFFMDLTAPTKVTKLAAAPVDPGEGNTAILLTWAASKDVSDIRYRVEYSTNKSFKKGTVQTIEVDYGAELSVELPVQAGKYVYYRVTAVDSFGNKSKAVSGS